eukprot:gene6838-7606_t
MEKDRLFKSYLETHVETLLYVFLPIIQNELVEFGRVWNSRHVRQSAAAPGGKPEILYTLPHQINFSEQGIMVTNEDLAIASEVIGIKHCPVAKNDDLNQLLSCYCQRDNIIRPSDACTGLDVYVTLLGCLESDGFEI